MRIRNVIKKTRSFLKNLDLLVMCWFYQRTTSGSGALVTSKNCPMNLIVENYFQRLLSPLVFGCLESLAEPAHLSSSYEAPLSRHTLKLSKCDHAATLTVLIVCLYLLDKFLPPLIYCQDLFLELILPLWVGFHRHLKHLFPFEEFVQFQKQAHPSIVT